MRPGKSICIIFCLSILALPFCKGQNKVDIDEFHFYVSDNFELIKEANDENVLLVLNDLKGITIIVQNKLNVLKTTLFKDHNEQETLKSMHLFKFKSYIKALNGYGEDEIKLDKIGKVPFSKQTFKYKEDGMDIEAVYDVRIIKLKHNYYAFYSFGIVENSEEQFKPIDNIIESLSNENF